MIYCHLDKGKILKRSAKRDFKHDRVASKYYDALTDYSNNQLLKKGKIAGDERYLADKLISNLLQDWYSKVK